MVYIITTVAFAVTTVVAYVMYGTQKKKYDELSVKYDSVMKYAQSLELKEKPQKTEASRVPAKKTRKKRMTV